MSDNGHKVPSFSTVIEPTSITHTVCNVLIVDWTITFSMIICLWYPVECDMGLDGTLTSHIVTVTDELDMACQSAI